MNNKSKNRATNIKEKQKYHRLKQKKIFKTFNLKLRDHNDNTIEQYKNNNTEHTVTVMTTVIY